MHGGTTIKKKVYTKFCIRTAGKKMNGITLMNEIFKGKHGIGL
jgi:hypothetical protein